MTSQRIAFLFPGQGAQDAGIIESLLALPDGPRILRICNDVAGIDLAARVRDLGEPALRQNEIASLLTAAHSLAAYQLLESGGLTMSACAGYSVGQWTAMAAAGMLPTEDLMRVILKRAEFMNAVPDGDDGVMLAVIGLGIDAVQTVCRDVSTPTARVDISNFNCVGQLTIAGHRAAVLAAQEQFGAMGARKLVELNVSGAWHCAMMTPACEPFRSFLAGIPLAAPTVPVADNVSGAFLPPPPNLSTQLAQQLDHPVQWEKGIRSLIAAGVERFIEVGYGTVLTKIGFFIDRSRQSMTYDAALKQFSQAR